MKRGIEEVEDVEEQENNKKNNIGILLKALDGFLSDYILLEMIYIDFLKQHCGINVFNKIILNPILHTKILKCIQTLELEGLLYEDMMSYFHEGCQDANRKIEVLYKHFTDFLNF